MLARVSELETYRRWREDPDAELADILPKLQGGFVATARMDAGTAFHKALELAQPGEFTVLQAMDHVFHLDVDAELELPLVREIRASIAYPQPDGGRLVVSGQVDATLGKRVDDHKTTAQMDAESYFAGYQWRLYLEIHGANTFRWNVFAIREASDRFLKDLPEELRALPGLHYVIHEAHQLQQHRYPGMDADCAKLAGEFYAFARQYLPERFVTEAA